MRLNKTYLKYIGKTVLKPDNLDRFKSVLSTMKKATLQSQHETKNSSKP
ncbi:hypothetical protein [Weissella cibaria]|nr:hypothetical protein [Weissella cibaria]